MAEEANEGGGLNAQSAIAYRNIKKLFEKQTERTTMTYVDF